LGQEACAVGVCTALEQQDVIASTHRPHGHAIAKGIPLREIAAELYGKSTGCCQGKGGSMHVGDLSRGMLPAIAIVGGNIPIVTGMALAFKLRGEKRVAVSFFGDGASNEGAFHEGLNAAAVYNVPALFVCENNLYGASTNLKQVSKVLNIADRAAAYGMRADIADGMNVFEVYEKAKVAAALAKEGKGPTLLELKTFRLCGHSRRDPNNYMSKEEKEYWKAKDPIPACETVLKATGYADKDLFSKIRSEVEQEVEEAMRFAQASPEPKPEDTYNGLYVTIEVPR
ncbi:MAG: thiamine pyrophosphate-dependent dehydrogenase E1 component subunit alpha, partial [Spirochaetota bacterium]